MIKLVFLLLSTIVISSPAVYSHHSNTKNDTSIESVTHNLIEGSIRFSLELLRTLNANLKGNKDSEGIFFSPYSVWSALVTIYLGARGTTEQEMRNILGVGDADKLSTWEAFRNMNPYLKLAIMDTYTSANRIFFQDGRTFKSCMKDMLDNDVTFIDFMSDADTSRKIINTWVERQTQQRIKDLIPRGGIDGHTNMIVANAVCFKAWPFKAKKGTDFKAFTTHSRDKIFVEMMSARGSFLYGRSEELQCYAIELPYQGNSLSITILLPYDLYNGIDILSNNLTPERLKHLRADMCLRNMMVSIPKFKLEDRFELSQQLRKMGLRTLFDPTRVNLSGFTGSREFTVGAVHHRSFIDASDEGTEAAFVTTAMSSKCAGTKGSTTFIANYPFVYFVRDNLSKVIIFLGTIQKLPGNGTS